MDAVFWPERVREVVGGAQVLFAIGFCQQDLALSGRDTEYRRLEIGTFPQGLRLQVFHARFQRLVSQIAFHVIVRRHCVVAEQFAQGR